MLNAGSPALGIPRSQFSCTAATLEEYQEKKKGVFPLDLSALIGKSDKEDVPVGYIPITHSVLGTTATMFGGSARGNAIIVYAKDVSCFARCCARYGATGVVTVHILVCSYPISMH